MCSSSNTQARDARKGALKPLRFLVSFVGLLQWRWPNIFTKYQAPAEYLFESKPYTLIRAGVVICMYGRFVDPSLVALLVSR